MVQLISMHISQMVIYYFVTNTFNQQLAFFFTKLYATFTYICVYLQKLRKFEKQIYGKHRTK
jgi:hypothetical protein